jgi:HEAT repeat protein
MKICMPGTLQIKSHIGDLFARLGEEVWILHEENMSGPVFGQDRVVEVIDELKVHQKEIREIKRKFAHRKKIKEKRLAFRRAIKELKNSDPKVRKAAASALEKFDDKKTVRLLSTALGDADKGVGRSAARVLHRIVDRKADFVSKNLGKAPNREVKDVPAE